MSSTTSHNRNPVDDFYETPEDVTHKLIKALGGAFMFDRVLEPAAGKGAIMRAYLYYDGSSSTALDGIEIHPGRAQVARERGLNVVTGSFFEAPLEPGQYDLIITNPPFADAMRFVQHSLWLAGRKGTVAMLLRLSWLASMKRKQLHLAYPADIYVLSKRPSFTEKGNDSADYAWFVWSQDRGGRWWVL